MKDTLNPITSVEAAKYVVATLNIKGTSLITSRVQKILYYLQGWNLVYFSSPLFPERPQAWSNGPTYPAVYEAFREYRYQFLPDLMTDDEKAAFVSKLDNPRQREIIDQVIETYGNLSPLELETVTMCEKPWIKQRVGLRALDRCYNEISHESMRSHFKRHTLFC